jgi:hypothetical protein
MPHFRQFFQTELQEAEQSARMEQMLAPYVFFFRVGRDLFGADENSRVIFAKMKHPDDDLPSGWQEEANFSGHNLIKTIKGEPAQHLFSLNDLKKVRVVDKNDIVDRLNKEADKLGDKAFPNQTKTFNLFSLSKLLSRGKDSDEAPNFVRADEK